MFCGIQNHFPPAGLGCTPCLNPCCAMGQGLAAPSSPCLSMASVCAEETWGGRELQLSPTSVLIGLAGLSIPCVIILPCTAVLVSDQHPSTLQQQTKTPTEMREKNAAFAAGKLLCVLLASVLISELHVICTGYNAVLVLIRDWCVTPVALAPPEGKVQPSVFI